MRNITVISFLNNSYLVLIVKVVGSNSQKDPENCWNLWEADLWKMQKAFADYAALDCIAECPEEKQKEIREGMQLFIDKYDALWY